MPVYRIEGKREDLAININPILDQINGPGINDTTVKVHAMGRIIADPQQFMTTANGNLNYAAISSFTNPGNGGGISQGLHIVMRGNEVYPGDGNVHDALVSYFSGDNLNGRGGSGGLWGNDTTLQLFSVASGGIATYGRIYEMECGTDIATVDDPFGGISGGLARLNGIELVSISGHTQKPTSAIGIWAADATGTNAWKIGLYVSRVAVDGIKLEARGDDLFAPFSNSLINANAGSANLIKGGNVTFTTAINLASSTISEYAFISNGHAVRGNGNVGIGTTTWGTSAAKVLGFGNATAPSTLPSGVSQIWQETVTSSNPAGITAPSSGSQLKLWSKGFDFEGHVAIGNGVDPLGLGAVVDTFTHTGDALIGVNFREYYTGNLEGMIKQVGVLGYLTLAPSSGHGQDAIGVGGSPTGAEGYGTRGILIGKGTEPFNGIYGAEGLCIMESTGTLRTGVGVRGEFQLAAASTGVTDGIGSYSYFRTFTGSTGAVITGARGSYSDVEILHNVTVTAIRPNAAHFTLNAVGATVDNVAVYHVTTPTITNGLITSNFVGVRIEDLSGFTAYATGPTYNLWSRGTGSLNCLEGTLQMGGPLLITDTAAGTGLIQAQSAFADSTATNVVGGNLIIGAGIGKRNFGIVNNTAGAVTVTISVNGTDVSLASTTNFTLGSDNTAPQLAVTATNLAAAINANSTLNTKVKATTSASSVLITKKNPTYTIVLSTNQSARIGVTNSTDGYVIFSQDTRFGSSVASTKNIESLGILASNIFEGAVILGGGELTGDVAPNVGYLQGQSAYSVASTNTSGGKIVVSGGLGQRYFTSILNTSGAVTVTIIVNGSSVSLASGSEFNLGSDNSSPQLAVTANNLAAAINANGTLGPKVTAVATGASVYLTKKSVTYQLEISSNQQARISTTSGVDGALEVPSAIICSGERILAVASKGAVEVTRTITNNANAISSFRARNTFNGSGNTPIGMDIAPTFAPSVSIALARGVVFGAFYAPPSGVTITDVYAGNTVNVYSDVAGAVTNGQSFLVDSPICLGALKPTNQTGLRIKNQGVSGMSNVYGLYIEAQSGGSVNYAAYIDGAITLNEQSGTPGNPASGTALNFYMKGDKFIIQFNDGGTVRWKYLDLTGTGVTWQHTTSAP